MHDPREKPPLAAHLAPLRKTFALCALAGLLAMLAEALGLVRVPLWLALIAFVPALPLLLPRLHLRQDTPQPAGDEVVLDAEGVRRLRGGHVLESVTWARLVRVAIATSDAGPWAEDLFWMLGADDGTGVAISGALASRVRLLECLGALPGFDHRAVIAASGCTEDALFECWTGSPGDALPCANFASDRAALAHSTGSR